MNQARSLLTDVERADRRAFLEARQRGIGASDLPRILQGDAVEIYNSKTRPITEADVDGGEGNIHLFRGNVMEPIAVELFFRVTGYEGRRESKQFFHPDYPGAMCSADGTIFGGDERGTGTLEAKAPSVQVFRRLVALGTSESILWQLIDSIATRRVRWGAYVFATLEDDSGPVIPVEINAQEDAGQFCLETKAEFWTKHVLTRTPPDPAKWAALLAKAPKIQERPEVQAKLCVLNRDADEEARTLVTELIRVNEVRRMAEEARDNVLLRMDAFFPEQYPGFEKFDAPGEGKLTRVHSRSGGGFDRELLEGHRPIDRDAFIRYLRSEEGRWVFPQEGEDLEALADSMALDLSWFKKPGKEYEFWKVTPAKTAT